MYIAALLKKKCIPKILSCAFSSKLFLKQRTGLPFKITKSTPGVWRIGVELWAHVITLDFVSRGVFREG